MTQQQQQQQQRKGPRVTIKKRSACICVFSVVNHRKIEGTLFALSAKYTRDIVDLNVRATVN